jgi:hypothetical protein
MKYFTFGISTLVKSGKSGQPTRPDAPRRTSTSSSKTITEQRHAAFRPSKQYEMAAGDEDDLARMEPLPIGQTLQTRIAMQKRLEQQGHFLVGLQGDLHSVPDDENAAPVDDNEAEESGGLRNVLRTIHVQHTPQQDDGEDDREDEGDLPLQRKRSTAGLSYEAEGSEDSKRHRVLVYVHRPFMYCFLFENRTPSLAVTSFYKDLHRNLLSIHRPLLSSTSYSKVAQRIDDAQAASSDTASITSGQSSNSKTAQPWPIYDLLYDPALLTVHTSIPNIAEPGTPAAEGILSRREAGTQAWTRIEALNVHSQILNTLSSVKRSPHEYERTSKTSRGWWVVWMKLPPSSPPREDNESESEFAPPDADEQQQQQQRQQESAEDTDNVPSIVFRQPNDPPAFVPPALSKEDSGETILPPSTRHASIVTYRPPRPMNRIAFLVRKASDPSTSSAQAKSSSTGSRVASSMWSALTLRPSSLSDANTGGAGAGWGPSALAGGLGVDPRKYVEGLLSLNR